MENSQLHDRLPDPGAVDYRPVPSASRSRYLYYIKRFHRELREFTHDTIQERMAFLPGMEGLPVRNSHPVVFWNHRGLYNYDLYEKAHDIISGLYYNFIRKEIDDGIDEEDLPAIVAIVNYAIWTGKHEFIQTLSFHYLEMGDAHGGMLLIAAILSRLEGREALAEYFYRQRPPSSHPYLMDVWKLISGRPYHPENTAGASHFWLRWMSGMAGENPDRMDRLMHEMRTHLSMSPDFAWRAFAALLVSGKIMRAMGLLRNSPHSFGNPGAVQTAILELLAINGKIPSFLRHLHISDRLYSRNLYYLTAYLIHESDNPAVLRNILPKVMKNKEAGDLPAPEMQNRFITFLENPESHLESTEGFARQLLDLVKLEMDSVDEVYSDERSLNIIIEEFINHPSSGIMRELLWNTRIQDILGRVGETLSDKNLSFMKSLAGRHFSIRIFLALYLQEHGKEAEARTYLMGAPVHHPQVKHALAMEYMNSGDFDRAERIYRVLLKHYKNIPLFWNNYATILTRMGELPLAREASERAAGLEAEQKETEN